MAIRTKNNRTYVTSSTRAVDCSSPIINTNTSEAGSLETWSGVFSRPKPSHLKVTYMFYRESINTEDRIVGCQRHASSTGYRTGRIFYCHNSNINSQKITFNSGSQVSMATILAKARFTSNSYAETLAESRRTARMIGNRIRTLNSLANAIRARDRIRADKIAARMKGEKYVGKNTQSKPISRRFADGWLEYQFGWLPVLSDIYDLVGYYNDRLYQGMQVGRSYTTNGGFSVSRDSTATDRARRIRNHGAAAKVAIRTRVRNPALRTLSEMGLLNPASLIWDLLPRSFVVDWLLPISSILKSLLYDVGLIDEDSYSITEEGGSTIWYSSCCGHYVSSYRRDVLRQPLGSGTLPRIFTNPRDMGLWHIITSTALLRQTIKGGRI